MWGCNLVVARLACARGALLLAHMQQLLAAPHVLLLDVGTCSTHDPGVEHLGGRSCSCCNSKCC